MLKNIVEILTRYRTDRLYVFVAIFLFSTTASTASAQSSKIGPGVLEAIQTENLVRVVVALDQTAPTRQNLSLVKEQIAQLQASVAALFSSSEATVVQTLSAVPAMAMVLNSESALNKLANHTGVLKIDQDQGGQSHLSNSVPLIGADIFHSGGIDGAGVVVAVLDSGMDTDHDDLTSALLDEHCFLDTDFVINGIGACLNGSDRDTGPGSAEDDQYHGTHVSGIVASRGNVAPIGVAPGAELVIYKVLDSTGTFYTAFEIWAALDHIVTNNTHGIEVINMSLGTFATFPGDCDNSTSWNMAGAAVISTLESQGITVFASAGNDGSSTNMSSPACLSKVLSVGASDTSDMPASFTNSNASTDIFAPGVSVHSSFINNGTAFLSGTSMASPTAAGCAALLIASGEATTPSEIEARLEDSTTTVTVPGNGLQFPRIDCAPRPLVKTCGGFPLDVDMELGQLPAIGNVSQVIGGTTGDDIINGYGGDDIICGGDGYDQIYGGGGKDTLYGGDGNGNDTSFNDLFGGTGADLLIGGLIDEANYLYGQGGGDQLFFGTTLEGGSGGDVLDNSQRTVSSTMKGGGNSDEMYGGQGIDTMNGGPGLDTMLGGAGDDIMAGGNARDTMYGDDGNDTMTGGAANDFMYGNADDDNISGNQGNDTIDGGAHIAGDTCNGGGQTTADTYVDCEITSGFPAPPAAPPAPLVRVDGRVPLTDTEVLAIDRCNLTVDQCLSNSVAHR